MALEQALNYNNFQTVAAPVIFSTLQLLWAARLMMTKPIILTFIFTARHSVSIHVLGRWLCKQQIISLYNKPSGSTRPSTLLGW